MEPFTGQDVQTPKQLSFVVQSVRSTVQPQGTRTVLLLQARASEYCQQTTDNASCTSKVTAVRFHWEAHAQA
jgi:hypothetical protein